MTRISGDDFFHGRETAREVTSREGGKSIGIGAEVVTRTSGGDGICFLGADDVGSIGLAMIVALKAKRKLKEKPKIILIGLVSKRVCYEQIVCVCVCFYEGGGAMRERRWRGDYIRTYQKIKRRKVGRQYQSLFPSSIYTILRRVISGVVATRGASN